MRKTILIFGFGYTARALADVLSRDGWHITGTTRDTPVKTAGYDIVQWPGTDMRRAIRAASHILVSIAPDAQGDAVYTAFHDEIRAAASTIEWFGYLSTTGVYGDHQGGWVNEETPLTPATKRGVMRVQAEAAWQDLARETGIALHIFRLAGIYGPGRGPFAKVKRGTARRIIKPGQVFSRIHVDDIAQALGASMGRGGPGRVYNICDDLAAPPEDVLAFAADLLGLPIPCAEEYATAEMSAMARSFYAESKRVSNARMKAELGVTLHYPTYRHGLRALSQNYYSA